MDAGERGFEQINVYILSLSSSSEYLPFVLFLGFPGGSDGKESSSNAEDLSSVPGVGRSSGGGMATHSSILTWRIPMNRGAGSLQSIHGVPKSLTRLSD